MESTTSSPSQVHNDMRVYYIITGIVVFVVCCVLVGIWWSSVFPHTSREEGILIINAYAEYHEEATRQSAFITHPGQGRNDARGQLHVLLTRILTETTDNATRLQWATEAEKLNRNLRAQVDAAAEVRESVEKKLAELSTYARKSDIPEVRSLLAAAHERQRIVSDIIATLYAINGQTDELLLAVLGADGELTDAHVLSINNATDAAQSRFDRLQTRYEELVRTDESMDSLAKALAIAIL